MFKNLCIPVVLAFAVVDAQAEQTIMIPIDHGSWETRGEATMVVEGYSRSLADTRCIQVAEFDPLEAFSNAGECQAIVLSRSSDVLKITVSCQSPNMPVMSGIVEFKFSKVEIDGTMHMEAVFGDDVISVDSTWHGERIGDCQTDGFAAFRP